MDYEQRIAKLEALVTELLTKQAAREIQQITSPLDDLSKQALDTVSIIGTGTPTSRNISIASTPTTITVKDATSTLIVQTPYGSKELLVK